MNYVTTNIRLSEDDYLRLKAEAAKKRKSLAAIIRERLGTKEKVRTKDAVRKILEARDKEAKILGKKLKDFDIVSALRQMREQK